MRILEFPKDLVTGPVTVHAFYVRYLLPIQFDVQCIEYADGCRARTALGVLLSDHRRTSSSSSSTA